MRTRTSRIPSVGPASLAAVATTCLLAGGLAVPTATAAPPPASPAPAAAPAVATSLPSAASKRRKLWKPNPARGSFSLSHTLDGATLTISGSGFRGLYEAYTWPENMGWQPAKGSPAANVTMSYSYSWENPGFYECQRTGAEYSASGSANVELVQSDYVDGFQLGGPVVTGDLFARKWKVKDRAFQLEVTFTVPMTVRRWSEDIGSGGCVVTEDPYNGTSDASVTVWLDGRLNKNNKTVSIQSFSLTPLDGMPNAFALDDPPASGTFTFKRDLRIRR